MTDLSSVDSTSTGKPDRNKSWLDAIFNWRALPYLVVFSCASFAVWLCAFFVQRAGDAAHPLSQLEQALFGVFTLLVGAGLSWLTSAYYSAQQARSQFQQLARPALRRVTAAKDSADALLVAIERRRKMDSESQHDQQECLASLSELVQQHARVLDDAIEDWREVLPEDVQAVHAQEARLSNQLLNARLDDVNEKLTAMTTAIAGKADPEEVAKQVILLQEEVSDLRKSMRAGRGGHIVDGVFVTPSDRVYRQLANDTLRKIKVNQDAIDKILDDIGKMPVRQIPKATKPDDERNEGNGGDDT